MPDKLFAMIARRSLVLTAGLFLTVSAFGYFFWYKHDPAPAAGSKMATNKKRPDDAKETLLRLTQRSLQAKEYVAGHGYNAKHCFLIDMRIASGKNRFFVYNLEKDSVEMAGLVAHGSGVGNASEIPVFSNTPNSYCTSLGRYRIGNSYNGKFGLAYKLYGLDKTNSKAFDRFVVLHAHACVPNEEVSPSLICESWGCPTVAPAFLTQLRSYLDHATAPVLLWIYY